MMNGTKFQHFSKKYTWFAGLNQEISQCAFQHKPKEYQQKCCCYISLARRIHDTFFIILNFGLFKICVVVEKVCYD
jgi:hypothetical protein